MTGPGLQPITRIVDQPAPCHTEQGLRRIEGDDFPKGGLAPIPPSIIQQRRHDPGEGLVNLTS